MTHALFAAMHHVSHEHIELKMVVDLNCGWKCGGNQAPSLAIHVSKRWFRLLPGGTYHRAQPVPDSLALAFCGKQSPGHHPIQGDRTETERKPVQNFQLN